jgi:hypothetical protein
MIKVSALERILVTERVRRHAAKDGGFAFPTLSECTVKVTESPFLATNMRGTFLPSSLRRVSERSAEGLIRYAFTECPLEDEGQLLSKLYRVLWDLSRQYQWSNRCKSIAEAKVTMEGFGLEPKALVAPVTSLKISAKDAGELMFVQGHMAKVEGLKILGSELSEGTAILAAAPSHVGIYMRSDDYLGILIKLASRSLVLVGDAVD